MGVKLERIVKPYYDWLHEGKIMARKCTKCGAVEWPPLLGCNTCGSPDMEWIEMSGKGQMVQMAVPWARRVPAPAGGRSWESLCFGREERMVSD